jgi:hypothetical protein
MADGVGLVKCIRRENSPVFSIFFDEAVIRLSRDFRLGVLDEIHRVDDVVGVEGLAITEGDALAQFEIDGLVIDPRPRGRQRGAGLALAVAIQQMLKHIAHHQLRGTLVRRIRVHGFKLAVEAPGNRVLRLAGQGRCRRNSRQHESGNHHALH